MCNFSEGAYRYESSCDAVVLHMPSTLARATRRTPESSLQGISIIQINFSKFGLRFTIRIKIVNFQNLTLVIRIDPANPDKVWSGKDPNI